MRLIALLAALVALIHSAPAGACLPCDLNDDGQPGTVQDFAVFLAAFGSTKGGPEYNWRVDYNQDGQVSTLDFAFMIKFCPLT